VTALLADRQAGAAVGTAAGKAQRQVEPTGETASGALGVGMRLRRNRNANGVCSRRAEGEEGRKDVVLVDSLVGIIYKVSADRRMKWPPV
jgi:hypothetical protein